VVPQILPGYLSYSLYVFELNLRASIVLGLVGAGGIGQVIRVTMANFWWERLGAVIVAVFVIVVVLDQVSIADAAEARVSTSTTRAPRPSVTRPTPPGRGRRTAGMVALAAAVLASAWAGRSAMGTPPRPPVRVQPATSDLMFQGVVANPVGDEVITGYWTNAIELMLESLQMAWLGTIIGALLSLPMGFLAARNVSPRPVVAATRAILNGIRGHPRADLGHRDHDPDLRARPDGGTMALGINSIGTLGKLTSEVIEGIDPGPVEAARASGARQLQILRWGDAAAGDARGGRVLAVPLRDQHPRGRHPRVVGAGGIGSLLSSVIGRRLWERAGILLAVIILVTIAVDLISARIRKRIIAGPTGDVERAGRGADHARRRLRVSGIEDTMDRSADTPALHRTREVREAGRAAPTRPDRHLRRRHPRSRARRARGCATAPRSNATGTGSCTARRSGG
jgi:phosphonate transport system permease protein